MLANDASNKITGPYFYRIHVSGVSALARREAGLQTGDILFIANILTTNYYSTTSGTN